MKSHEFIKEEMSSGSTGVGAIAGIAGTKKSPQVGSLFGGSFQQPINLFIKKGRKKGVKNK